MIKNLTSIFVLLFCFSQANAIDTECPVYTPEQEAALKLAYEVGYEDDLGMTLAAIVVQESFVGPYIIRENPNDYSTHKRKDGSTFKIRGSVGLPHILLSTGMWLEGYTSVWKARAELVPKLFNDDKYALQLALRKLKSVQKPDQDWRTLVSRYNGAGPAARSYAKKIAKHVNTFKKCRSVVEGIFETPVKEVHVFGLDNNPEPEYIEFKINLFYEEL
jgi:hypothetical protein